MKSSARILVAGADTLIGSALLEELAQQGYANCEPVFEAEPDWTSWPEVDVYFARTRPEYVFLAAGKSGGIAANQKYPAELMRDNLLVNVNVLEAAHRHGVKKLLYLASSCCYPRECPQPMKVEHLLTGKLEPTNEAYATAKIAGLNLAIAYRQQYGSLFIVGIPANAFGPGDCLDPENAHVITGMMRRMHQAKILGRESVEIWGTGTPRREFIFARDLAAACIVVMDRYDAAVPINLGGGQDCSIRELAELIKELADYPGRLEFNPSRPDGMPLKALDSARLCELGWQPRYSLREGLQATWRWFQQQMADSAPL